MRIDKYYVIYDLLTNQYFRTYKENNVEEVIWKNKVSYATIYHSIGSVNYDLKKYQIFLKDTYLEIKEVKVIRKE
jgi:hypothetical protein